MATLSATARIGTDAVQFGRHKRNHSRRASALAERVLRVDPSARSLQDVAALLAAAAAAIGRADTDDAQNHLDRAATGLAAALRADLLDAPAAGRPGRGRLFSKTFACSTPGR